jgi:hypothetical protein
MSILRPNPGEFLITAFSITYHTLESLLGQEKTAPDWDGFVVFEDLFP